MKMGYLADTVALVRHLGGNKKLGRNAARILQEADQGVHHVYVSAITLMEILYLSEAQRINIALTDLLAHIRASDNYILAPVDDAVILTAQVVLDVPELHDRIIVATAVYLGVPILTSDMIISNSVHVNSIW